LNKSQVLTLDMMQNVYKHTARKEDELRRLLIKALCYGPIEIIVQDERVAEICRAGGEMMEDLIAEIQRKGIETEEKAAADRLAEEKALADGLIAGTERLENTVKDSLL
jgi:hypothetical protein